MNPQTLQTLSKLRKVNQADLARMARTSRQAVSQWLRRSGAVEVNVQTSHLRRLADGLRVSADDLLTPLPLLNDSESVRRHEAALLWDRLYPDLTEYAVALVRGEAPALARLTHVYGLYGASKIAGQKIWNRFPEYKKHIRPVRREQLERVWNLRQNPISI